MSSYAIMRTMIDELDKKVISLIQGDLPLEPRPFALLAREMGISEDQFVDRVRRLKEQGIIRRFGATLRHQEAGYNSNAMVAWKVPHERVDEAGQILAKFQEVTHCYQRRPAGEWQYNLYTMIHGSTREECYRMVTEMSRAAGIPDYLLLFSEKEFKKTSMEYF